MVVVNRYKKKMRLWTEIIYVLGSYVTCQGAADAADGHGPSAGRLCLMCTNVFFRLKQTAQSVDFPMSLFTDLHLQMAPFWLGSLALRHARDGMSRK
jgi:hypothetical protein